MPTATDFKDYYAVLDIDKTATPAEIKRAYRKLARKYHPDLNPGDKGSEDKFKELNEANAILSDVEKRQKYDQFGQSWNQPSREAAPSESTNAPPEDFRGYSDFDSFIEDLLGRGGARTSRSGGFGDGGGFHSQAPAPDTEAAIALTFSEAFHGVQKRLKLDDQTINVRIPAGAKPGSRIRLKGKGRPSPFSGQRGDLYLTIEMLAHPFFRFEKNNLVCDIPLRPDEAVLGAQISVPTPNGSVMMKVPKGVQAGQSLRLRGKGWKLKKGGQSDLLVKLQIAIPRELSSMEQEYYEKIQAHTSFNPRIQLEDIEL